MQVVVALVAATRSAAVVHEPGAQQAQRRAVGAEHRVDGAVVEQRRRSSVTATAAPAAPDSTKMSTTGTGPKRRSSSVPKIPTAISATNCVAEAVVQERAWRTSARRRRRSATIDAAEVVSETSRQAATRA